MDPGQIQKVALAGFAADWVWDTREGNGIKKEARVVGLSYTNDGTAINQDGKIVAGQDLVCWGMLGALFGHATFEKPTRHLSGDTLKAGEFSRVKFRGVVQAGDINLEVISSTRMD